MKPIRLLVLLFAITLCASQSDAQWVQIGLSDRGIGEIAVGSPGLFAITNDSGSVFRSTNSGTQWVQIIESNGSQIALAANGTVYMTMVAYADFLWSQIQRDSLCKSTDSGNSWTTLHVREQIDTAANVDGFGRIVIAPYGYVFTGLRKVWVGWEETTVSSAIVVSTDEGSSWISTGEGGLGFAFRGNSVLTRAQVSSYGTAIFLFSSDSGMTWKERGLAEGGLFDWCSNGNVVHAGVSSGLLYISCDTGATYMRIASLVAPSAILALPRGGVLVGTDAAGIYLFSDNGDSLGTLNEGLTDLHIHAFALDSSGYAYVGTNNGVWRRPLSDLLLTRLRVPQDFPTIQAAIDAAHHGDTVLVSEGTYYENILIDSKSIVVASHYIVDGDTSHISRTIVNGSRPVSPDSGSVVTITSCKDTTTQICGFTITGGTGTIRTPGAPGSPPYPLRLGGGILCWNSSSHIRGNHIVDNVCTIDVPDGHAQGAGIACAPPFTSNQVIIDGGNTIERNTAWAKGSASSWTFGWAQGGGVFAVCSGRIEGNLITTNICRSEHGYAVGAGIRLSLSGTTHVSDNDIIRNSSESSSWNAFAGGVSCSGANMVLDGNRIIGNIVQCTGRSTANGAGVYLDLGNDENWAVISGNRIQANSGSQGTSLGGAIGMYTSSPEVFNNIIDGNAATSGGAISAYEYSRPRLVNNTIVSNTASVGGGFYADHSTVNPVILNTILWDNTASVAGSEIYLSPGASATVAYSNVEGGWTGEHIIDTDPLFLDTTYRLSDPSPCIGAGIDSLLIGGVWYRAPGTCFYGPMRPNPPGSKPDIGACENLRSNPVVGGMGNQYGLIPAAFSLEQNYPNPFNSSTTIRYELPASSMVKLSVFDILGREASVLVNERKEAGVHDISFDASAFSSGLYLYRLTAGDFVDSKKLHLVK